MNKDQVKGRTKQAKGKVKETAGKVADDEAIEIKGKVEKNLGKGQAAHGNAKEKVKKSR